jgi:ketosteroid isomerase-like protein
VIAYVVTGGTRVDEKELLAAERRLQAAQLASDVAALDTLLDDRLVFTGPDGARYGKQDDLRVHRTGTQVIDALHEEDVTVLVAGSTGVTWFLGSLRGSIDGTPFEARMRYTRTWVHDPGHGWRIIAAHAGVV